MIHAIMTKKVSSQIPFIHATEPAEIKNATKMVKTLPMQFAYSTGYEKIDRFCAVLKV